MDWTTKDFVRIRFLWELQLLRPVDLRLHARGELNGIDSEYADVDILDKSWLK
jgi:hypothetical protein